MVIDVMKKGFRFFPSNISTLFWGAGHLTNTFHHETGINKHENFSFSLCTGIAKDEERKELLMRTGMPYNEWTLDDIKKLAGKSAPDILEYYESLGYNS